MTRPVIITDSYNRSRFPGSPPTLGKWGPYRASNGAIYVIADVEKLDKLELLVFKSADDGETWTEITPGTPLYTLRQAGVDFVNDIFYFVYYDRNLAIAAATFDTTNDTYSSAAVVLAGNDLGRVGVTILSDSSQYIVYSTEAGNITLLKYASGVIAETIPIGSGFLISVIHGSGDNTHIFYNNAAETQLLHRRITTTTVGDETIVFNDANANEKYGPGIFWNGVPILPILKDTRVQLAYGNTEDPSNWSYADVSDKTPMSVTNGDWNFLAVTVDGDDLYIAWETEVPNEDYPNEIYFNKTQDLVNWEGDSFIVSMESVPESVWRYAHNLAITVENWILEVYFTLKNCQRNYYYSIPLAEILVSINEDSLNLFDSISLEGYGTPTIVTPLEVEVSDLFTFSDVTTTRSDGGDTPVTPVPEECPIPRSVYCTGWKQVPDDEVLADCSGIYEITPEECD